MVGTDALGSARQLPILLSVPHAGVVVPEHLAPNCRLTPDQIVADGDEFAERIWAPLRSHVAQYCSTAVARAVLDLNRAETDRRADGVVKTHTCQGLEVWHEPLADATVEHLLASHYRPYHHRLSRLARVANRRGLRVAIDGHTMMAVGPAISPDRGQSRPLVNLGTVGRTSLPPEWIPELEAAFESVFPNQVTVDEPFAGGHITRSHAEEMPWVQIELSRDGGLSPAEKSRRVLTALNKWCAAQGWSPHHSSR